MDKKPHIELFRDHLTHTGPGINGEVRREPYWGNPRRVLEHVLHCWKQSGYDWDDVRVTAHSELLMGPIDSQGLADLLFRRAGKFNGPPCLNLIGTWSATFRGVEREDGSGTRFNLLLSLPEHGGLPCRMFVELED